MPKHELTLSVANASAMTENIHSFLIHRKTRIKKSDCKELVSKILNFETSNEMDAEIKKHNEKKEALSVFRRDGQHKHIKNFIFKHFHSPFQLKKFVDKYQSFDVIFAFTENFELEQGVPYKINDFIFARDQYEVFKYLVHWEKNSSLEYILDEDDFQRKGDWHLTLDYELDTICASTFGKSNYLASEGAVIDDVEKALINDLLAEEWPFLIFNRSSVVSYISDWIDDYYAFNFPKQPNDKEYIAYIQKFLPEIGIDEIIKMEVYDARVEQLQLLSSIKGADFSRPCLMISAASGGNIDVCNFLIKNGNSLTAFTNKCEYSETTFFHQEALNASDEFLESTKNFFNVAIHYGININLQDNNKNTVLHYSASLTHDSLYKFLVGLNAQENIKNIKGHTPASIREQFESEHGYSIFDLFN